MSCESCVWQAVSEVIFAKMMSSIQCHPCVNQIPLTSERRVETLLHELHSPLGCDCMKPALMKQGSLYYQPKQCTIKLPCHKFTSTLIPSIWVQSNDLL